MTIEGKVELVEIVKKKKIKQYFMLVGGHIPDNIKIYKDYFTYTAINDNNTILKRKLTFDRVDNIIRIFREKEADNIKWHKKWGRYILISYLLSSWNKK